jgi:RNA polymerase sigma-70 factor (ECF subfamily)
VILALLLAMTSHTSRLAARSPQEQQVRAAIAGDPQAFTALHGHFAPMVHAILLSRGPAQEAEDLTQETFLRAWQRLPTLKDPSRFGPWLASIARNLATDRLRRPRLTVVDQEPRAPARPTSEAAEVLRHLRALPEAYREPLMMRLIEGMTGPEIAQKTGLTPGSVRVNLHRGMKMLRASLGAQEAP